MDDALSASTYMLLLRTCNQNKFLQGSRQICTHALQHKPKFPEFLGNYLVISLAKCGAIEEACSIFQALPSRTVYSWTAIISAHAFGGYAKKALDMQKSMVEDGVNLSSHTYVSLIKACGIIEDLQKGRELHAETRMRGFASDIYVNSTLISMYGKCGDIAEAESVFVELDQRNVISWNAMLSAYAKQAKGREGLQCYRQMQEEGMSSDQHTFLFALHACSSLIDQEKGFSTERQPSRLMSVEIVQSLYADAQRKGFTSDVFVGSTFVRVFGKCGAITEAEHAFQSLSQCNVVSWTAILATYVEHEIATNALHVYRQMHVEGLNPDGLAAIGALQACISLAEKKEPLLSKKPNKLVALEIGQAVGADACGNNATTDVLLGTALLTMFGKCGAILEAEHTFVTMSERSYVSWNALLSVYVDQGHLEKTLHLFWQMQMEGMHPDQHAFVSALQAVCSLADYEDIEGWPNKTMLLRIGYGLHSDARKKGISSDVFVGNTLVSMYGKCGVIAEAEQAFLAMPFHNVVSWTAILSAYLEQGQGAKVLKLYLQMLEESIRPDNLALVIVLQACGILAGKEVPVNEKGEKTMALEIGRALHYDLRTFMLEFDNFVCTALLNLYGKCGAMIEAENVFMSFVSLDVVSWSAMLSAYVDQNCGEKALLLYRQMLQEGLQVDAVTSVVVLQACSALAESERTLVIARNTRKTAALEIGRAVHADAYKKQFAYDLAVGNTIINMYGNCGVLSEAEHVFGVLNIRNIVTWNAMIAAYAEQGEDEQALMLFKEMHKHCITADEVTLIFALKASCSMGCLDVCHCLYFDIICAGRETSSLSASLIHAYGRCASLKDATSFLNELSEFHLGSWNACITSYAGEGDCTSSLFLLEEMKLMGIKPDGLTFISVISACSHTGIVVEGAECFMSMSCAFRIVPEGKHYGSIVDLFARAGDFSRVNSLLKSMPMPSDESVWLCLLGACHTHYNVELAKYAFDHALMVQPKHAAAYVALSNVYAYAGIQDAICGPKGTN
ncbi:hypothetical protein KP509_11G090500 [Ceratopteris richardii]|nr:hypothetical protein KP509_11G090500 [Ceratopteris richardii]